MSDRKRLVLNTNILLRAVFGTRVRALIEACEDAVDFYSPDVCFEDAREYIPDIARRKGFDSGTALTILQQVERVVQPIERNLYQQHENVARLRISRRDPEDWPVLATALLLDAPGLDGGSRFFRRRCGDMDDRPS